MFKKIFHGVTDGTLEKRATGAGAYFKNFIVGTDTYESAVTSGKLIGATKGGGEFNAKPVIKKIEADGINEKVKGFEDIDYWDVSMTANVLEVSEETLKLSLACATSSTPLGITGYKKIEGKSTIEDVDYENNITFLGTWSGSESPIIIQIYNAIQVDGLKYGAKHADDTVIPMKFEARYTSNDLENPPFAIFVPVTSETLNEGDN